MQLEPKVYVLKYPVTVDGNEITKITLQPPRGKHLRKVKGAMTTSELMDMVSAVSGELPRVIDELHAVDVMGVTEVLGDFLGTGQATGQN